MVKVTALRERRGGKVDVELDGAPWRTLPVEVVVRAELAEGLELERGRLRRLRRELRRAEALGIAVRTLRRRDLSRSALDARLAAHGVSRQERAEAVATLERAGYVDDARYAAARAAALAERGRGDAGIRWELERHGLPAELAEAAVASLEPEAARAAALVARRGASPATARRLAAGGFSAEAIEAALGPLVAEDA